MIRISVKGMGDSVSRSSAGEVCGPADAGRGDLHGLPADLWVVLHEMGGKQCRCFIGSS